jgi:hypothetical protein
LIYAQLERPKIWQRAALASVSSISMSDQDFLQCRSPRSMHFVEDEMVERRLELERAADPARVSVTMLSGIPSNNPPTLRVRSA